MAEIPLNLTVFRQLFPAFADPTLYSDALITAQYGAAAIFVTNQTGQAIGGGMSDATLGAALNYMTAHLLQLAAVAAGAAGSGGIVTSATIDKVSVTVKAPPETSQWAWWLGQTPYGAQLLALLSAAGVGGAYFGGRPEIRAMRKVGGLL